MTTSSSIEFPCDFQVKIIGINHGAFKAEMTRITSQYFPEDASIQERQSQQGRYLALTVTVRVQDKASLDAYYTALSRHPDVKMVL